MHKFRLFSTYKNVPVYKFMICVFWLTGMLLAFFFAFQLDFIHISWMRSVLNNRVSIIGLMLIQTFPLILTLLFSRYIRFWVLLIAFIKAFIYSCTYSLIIRICFDFGWPFMSTIFISDMITAAVTFHIWLQFADRKKPNLLTAFTVICTCCLADCYVISPVLGMLYF